jgi:hypothetical protein
MRKSNQKIRLLSQLVITLALFSLFPSSLTQEITQDTVPDKYRCGSLRPTKSTECSSLNTNEQFCCMMTNSRGQSFCYRINSSEWKLTENWEINNRSYSMKCDVVEIAAPSTTGTPPTSNEGFNSGANAPVAPSEPTRRPNECGRENPRDSRDCTGSNTMTEYCCLLTNPQNNQSFCKRVSPLTFQTSMTTMRLDSTDYKISCDVEEGAPGSPCGVINPSRPYDCTSRSIDNNSCCHYSSEDLSYCFWLGYRADPYVSLPSVSCY